MTGEPSGGAPVPAAANGGEGPLYRFFASTQGTDEGFTLETLEKWGVVVVLLLMTALPAAEAIARRVFSTGVPGSILYVQHLTLWIGFLGALLATGRQKHLTLSTGELIGEGRQRRVARLLSHALSAAVCSMLAYASVKLVQADAQQPRTLPGGVPEWWSELVMPVALGLMALRFAWLASDRWRGRAVAFLAAGGVFLLALLENQASRLVVPGLVVILGGLLLGTPVFVAMAGAAMLLFYGEGTAIASVPTETYRLVASSTLPAIPLLTVAGYVLAEGGASARLLRLARALVGWLPGGLAVMVTLVCAAFTTFTGGSGVTILALGGLVFPMLVKEKYPEGFSLGLVTSAGSLGLLFPPSLPVILYAVVAGASVEELYIAGFVPGLLRVVAVATIGLVVGMRAKAPRQRFGAGEVMKALWGAKWELAIPAIVVAAIFTGFATMVEAAALSLAAAIVSQVFIFRDIHWRRELPQVLAHGATLVGAVVILLGVAMGLTSWLVDAEIPAKVLDWTTVHIHSPALFLLAMNAVLLVLGSILEVYAAIVVLAPLLAPMAGAYSIDPVHLGIVFLANLELGFLFPPMGLNLILSSSRFGEKLPRLYRVTLPFLLVMTAVGILVTYVPALSVGVLHWIRR